MLKIRRSAGLQLDNGSENGCMEHRFRRIEKSQIALAIFCAGFSIALGLASAKIFPNHVSAAEAPSVLHVKGLVIEDEQGRARILLGAPFPTVPERLRQDETTAALLFLDEHGHDRFSIGAKMAPQINGTLPANYHKPGDGYGVTLYDQAGNERGGMGFLSNGSTMSRAVFGLDRPTGDAIGAVVDDTTGYAGLVAMYPPRNVGVEATGILLGTQGDKAYLSMQDSHNRPNASFSVGDESIPSLQVFDRKGKSGPNLLKPPAGDRTITETQ
jgi:hypothetical protein